MSNLHQTAAYRAWRTEVLAKCEPTCIRCGYPVDMTLPGSHPDGPTADHEPPLAETGEIAPSLRNLNTVYAVKDVLMLHRMARALKANIVKAGLNFMLTRKV